MKKGRRKFNRLGQSFYFYKKILYFLFNIFLKKLKPKKKGKKKKKK